MSILVVGDARHELVKEFGPVIISGVNVDVHVRAGVWSHYNQAGVRRMPLYRVLIWKANTYPRQVLSSYVVKFKKDLPKPKFAPPEN